MNVILYDYDKDYIKNNLTIDDIVSILTEWHGEPQIINDNLIICKTICHNSFADLGEASHKLYYYANTNLFHCFTDCGSSFDIFELAQKVLSREFGSLYDLPHSIEYIANFFGYQPINRKEQSQMENLEDWKILNHYDRIKNINFENQSIELKVYDDNVLKNLPTPLILPWIEEGICEDAMKIRKICYDPRSCGIVIPHMDINNNLIGIRERGLVKEEIEIKGKYRPAYLNNKLYTHPLGFNLYNLNLSKDNIKKIKKAIVFESEKSCMQYASMFGQENDISVACCGSAFSSYQAWLLINLKIDEIIIALDRQFQELGDKEHIKLVKNLRQIYKKYGNYVKISFIFDKNKITPYKASPTDCGRDIFLKLFKERITLYNEK